MIKHFMTLLLFIAVLHANSLERLHHFYMQNQYEKACQLGLRLFKQYRKNADFLMLYGFSCLKADYIDRLAIPITALRATKTERANASYFAAILLQKKLLYHALLDDVDISNLHLPSTDYVLSKVFDLYSHNRYQKIEDKYYLSTNHDNGLIYVLYIESNGKDQKMVIEERLNGNIIKIHKYW